MEVKGTAVETLPLFVKSRFGDSGFREWLQSLPEPGRKVYSSVILSSNWYPLREALVEPTGKLCEVFFRGDLRGALEQGRFSADYALKGIYKLFVRLGTPDFLIGKASTILPTYYKPSTMQVVEKGHKKSTVRIAEFPEMDPVIEMRIKGWMLRALEISGAVNPQVKVASSLTRGAPHTDFAVTWM